MMYNSAPDTVSTLQNQISLNYIKHYRKNLCLYQKIYWHTKPSLPQYQFRGFKTWARNYWIRICLIEKLFPRKQNDILHKFDKNSTQNNVFNTPLYPPKRKKHTSKLWTIFITLKNFLGYILILLIINAHFVKMILKRQTIHFLI